MKVFVDSDVIISSLLSQSGAAYLLINTKNLGLFISNISYKELEIVTERLGLEKQKLKELLKTKFKIIELKESLSEIKRKYEDFVFDPNDAHIAAGAKEAKTSFLLTYNQKHFNTEKIKKHFGIITMKPALFLQYLRSLQK